MLRQLLPALACAALGCTTAVQSGQDQQPARVGESAQEPTAAPVMQAGQEQQPHPLVQAGRAYRPAPSMADEWERLIAADDARVRSAEHRAVVTRALASSDDALRAIAVRALGRTERNEFATTIAPFLDDPAASVSAAAAHAIVEATGDSAEAFLTRELLLSALARNGTAMAAIAESLGRLPADASAAQHVAERVIPLLRSADAARLGALRGLYFLARRPAGRTAVRTAAADALRNVARQADTPRERALAVATLAAAGAADSAILGAALRDADPQVRREAAAALRGDQTRALLDAALADPHPSVRYAAFSRLAPLVSDAADPDCAAVARAARDASVHVARPAILLLGATCGSPANIELFDSIASAMPAGRDGWHLGAQATIALAVNDAARARPHVQALARHANPFARVYAAPAARHIGDTDVLYRLAADSSANVRTAAVGQLRETVGHAADSVYLAQLDSNESELLMAATEALAGTTHPQVLPRLLDALDRVSALRRETSRDGRRALLHLIAELGDARIADRIRPYLNDFDDAVVADAVNMLDQWTGTRPQGETRPLPRLSLPTYDEAVQLARTEFVIELQGGGAVTLRLLPFDAPTNAARFARLARSGYFDGLTFHRVVTNFVVQGGSPGANEYSGDGPFTRDELGVPNWRGTVGLSTRGRDTGDGQIYINLIDNVRLDHEYTVFAVVTGGMDVVDQLLEGAVIREVVEGPLD
ncbi:MAG TPA: peptidylprolyl isomerase [Longimicrobiales bacterium]|nr:peptidylprolyl isomerase [Longimicrobiales bacterium]